MIVDSFQRPLAAAANVAYVVLGCMRRYTIARRANICGERGLAKNMEIPVELNKERQTARVVFAGKNDFGFVTGWRDKLADDQNPFRRDAVEFAQLAVDRYSAHSAIQPYVGSIDDIGDHITDDPKCEVAGFALLKSDWFPDSEVIGMCHFRRTWCNNIILDYLSAHPFITRPPAAYSHIVLVFEMS